MEVLLIFYTNDNFALLSLHSLKMLLRRVDQQYLVVFSPYFTATALHLFLGHVLRSMGKDQEARDAYIKATKLSPTDASAWNMAGVMHLSLGEFEAAASAFEEALRLDPLLAHVLINQGLLAQARGDYESAVSLFSQAARRNPAFLHSEWNGYVEYDPFREFYYETIFKYAGLGYHLAYCMQQHK